MSDSQDWADTPGGALITSSLSIDFDPMSFTLQDSSTSTPKSAHTSGLTAEFQTDSLEPPATEEPLDTEEKFDVVLVDSLNGDLHISEGRPSPTSMEEEEEDVFSPECEIGEEGDVEEAKQLGKLISVAKLKTNYTQNAQNNSSLSSPTKETIETGVNIEYIKSTLKSPQDESQVSKENDFLQTNVSVRNLSSTFTSPPAEDSNGSCPASPVELRLSIDKDMLAQKFSQNGGDEVPLCKICNKPVYQMEKIYAEKNNFHKLCFRCVECNKTLTVDTYCSQNGQLFCKPHFKLLQQPSPRPASINKDVIPQEETEEIKENIPEQLPPDVVRSESKADDGITQVPVLTDLRSKFESRPTPAEDQPVSLPPSDIAAIHNSLGERMAQLNRYQSRASGGVPTEEPPPAASKEVPIPVNLSSLKKQWESGAVGSGSSGPEKTGEIEELEQLRLHSASFRSQYESACRQTPASSPRPAVRAVEPPQQQNGQQQPERAESPPVEENGDAVDHAAVDEELPVLDTTRRVLGYFQSMESNGVEEAKPPYKMEEDIQVEACLAKSLKAKFEKMEEDNRRNEDAAGKEKHPRAKVNRFIEQQASMEQCDICQKKLYPMEKMETSGLRLHKNCFRCVHCSCILRLENYTTSARRLYCTPHFKQLFISKGNYDEGFGREQHKEKWNRSRANTPVGLDSQLAAA